MEKAEDADEIPDRDRITLGLVALAGRERDMILEAFREQLDLGPAGGTDALGRRPPDRAHAAGGRDEYRAAGRLSLGRGRWYRLACPAQPAAPVGACWRG
jgi:monovalent cation:H+ antiporter, CPA1 family